MCGVGVFGAVRMKTVSFILVVLALVLPILVAYWVLVAVVSYWVIKWTWRTW